MALTIEVAGAAAVPDRIVALGIPVLAGDDGPELFEGMPAEVGGTVLPGPLGAEWCRRQGFTAKAGQTLLFGAEPGRPIAVLVGIGPRAGLDEERWRRAAAAFVRSAGERGTAVLVLPPAGASVGPGGPGIEMAAEALGTAIAEGAALAAYRFEQFRTKPRPAAIEKLVLVAAEDPGPSGPGPEDGLRAGTVRGSRAAQAVAWARDLINTPPSDLPPRRFAERIVAELQADEQVTLTVWDEGRIAEERLGGLLGVSRGTAEPPRLVQADYQPADPIRVGDRVPHVVLVGKGITFDSGGLSLKTPDGMTTMKTDMSGAAVVLGAVSACADLGVRVRVTAIAPISENMPGSRAIKPGDVLTMRNGATVEVLNTDAEGRLVLADALVLASELEPDAIIDVATLTGAAAAALGTSIAALFGSDDQLVERLRDCGERSGERLWPLPLPEEYADHIDSDVADMKNIGKPGQAGAISAAMLLARFVGDTPWAHLDIAGTARSAESSGYVSKGGTAFGVRALLRFLTTYGSD